MISRLVLIIVVALGVGAVRAQDTNNVVRFRAKIEEVAFLQKFSGKIIFVGHIDPRFALKVRIVSTNSANTNFMAGSVVTFAIHSPAQLLFDPSIDGAKGKTHDYNFAKGRAYDFTLRQQIENGRTNYSDLGARSVSDDKKKGETR